MSLINDALKQAKQSQTQIPPGGAPPLPPLDVKREPPALWPLAVAIILFAASILIFVVSTHSKKKNAPTSMTNTPALAQAKPSRTSVGENPNTNPAATNELTATIEQFPKIQGIIYDPAHPVAIVDRQTVHVGDRAGNYKIAAISRMSVTFQRADGSDKEIKIGEQ
jgi:hypothetical protein